MLLAMFVRVQVCWKRRRRLYASTPIFFLLDWRHFLAACKQAWKSKAAQPADLRGRQYKAAEVSVVYLAN